MEEDTHLLVQKLDNGPASQRQRLATSCPVPTWNHRPPKRQAASGPANSPPLGQTRKKRNTSAKRAKAVTKPSSHIHRLLESEIPSDTGGLQVRDLIGLIVIRRCSLRHCREP